MTVYVEHLARPGHARAVARVVAGNVDPDEDGQSELRTLLRLLGFGHLHCDRSVSGHPFTTIPQTSVIRALHAGAIPVETDWIDQLLTNGKAPTQIREPAAADYHMDTSAVPATWAKSDTLPGA